MLCIHFTIELKLQTKGWWSLSTLTSEITLVTKVVAKNYFQTPPCQRQLNLLSLNTYACGDP